MKGVKRILSAALAVLMLLTVMLTAVGCTRVTTLLEVEPTAEEKRVVGKVGEFDIYYDELRYITMTYKVQMEEKYGEGIWKTEQSAAPYIEELEKKVFESITANYAALAVAKENGISTGDSAVQDYVFIQYEELAQDLRLLLIEMNSAENEEPENTGAEGEEDGEENGEDLPEGTLEEYVPTFDEINKLYRDQLDVMYLTDRYVRFTYAVDGCIRQLSVKYTENGKLLSSDEDIIQYIKSKFCRTLHVFIRNDYGESVEKNREDAYKVLDALNDGKTFNQMVGSKYNDDLMTTSVNGHYFAKGEMVPEYEEAAYALEIGKYSGVIETEQGFYIIQRLPIEDDYVNVYFEDLKIKYQYAVINNDISNKRAELSFVPNDLGKTIELWSME